MSTVYRLAEAAAVVRRPDGLTLLALDGRLDPEPVVVRGSGVPICDALQSWATVSDIVDTVGARFEDAPTDEIAAGVRGFIDGLIGLGIIVTRASDRVTDGARHIDA